MNDFFNTTRIELSFLEKNGVKIDSIKVDGNIYPIIYNKYILIERLGQGGFGIVFRGVEIIKPGEFQVIAIKIQKPIKIDKTNKTKKEIEEEIIYIKELVLHEINMLKHIQSIPRLCEDFICFNNAIYYGDGYIIVTNLINGIELRDLIDNESYNANEGVIVINQIIKKVMNIHQLGIAHLDLKPENIMVNPVTMNVNIIDLGAVCVIGNECVSIHTKGYLQKNVKYSDWMDRKRGDIWAIIVIIMEMMGMNKNFRGNEGYTIFYYYSVFKKQNKVSKDLEKILARMIKEFYKEDKSLDIEDSMESVILTSKTNEFMKLDTLLSGGKKKGLKKKEKE